VDPLQVSIFRPARVGRRDFFAVACWPASVSPVPGLPRAVSRAVALLRGGAPLPRERGEVRFQTLGSSGGTVGLLSLGEQAALDSRAVRSFCRDLFETAGKHGAERIVLALPDEIHREDAWLRRWVAALGQAAYRYERFLPASKTSRARALALVAGAGGPAASERALAAALPVVHGSWVSRTLANTPPNLADPAWMARQASRLAGEHGMRVRVLGPSQMRRRGMGGILAVGSGSAKPPRLVRIEYGKGPHTVALVGKGVTFDTGGISIKPSQGMEDMVFDKSGACLVLGVLEAAARLRLALRLRAYLPFAENMPDGQAYRPGDIVRCLNGKTVEIVNTDAEGRMILADAMVWAAQERPDTLLEFSTLTGACVVALGHEIAGLFTPNDGLATELLAASERAGEPLWRLPLAPQFLEDMKGHHATLKNSGGRWGGASTAAAFLGEFVGGLDRWAHIDIAGPASGGHDAPGPKGASGYGVAWVVEWLRQLESAARARRSRSG